jgi:anti-sigma regulatory factor (Ser/Thr protein kinase)
MLKIINTSSDKLSKQLECYYKNIQAFENSGEKEWYFEGFKWSPPLLSTLLTCYICENNIKVNDLSGSKYLDTIKFSNGINLYDIDLKLYTNKNYLPIVKIPIDNEDIKREELLSGLINKIVEICKLKLNYKTALNYLVSEFIDNLIQHSNSDKGYISFQNYPSKNYLDLCICDSGTGFLNSYKNYIGEKDFSNISNDIDAIEAVLKGYSTKQQKERGFGIRTSSKIIVNGLSGTIIIGSGSALSVNSFKNYSLDKLGWFNKGTYIIIRIPTSNFKNDFTIYDYLE